MKVLIVTPLLPPEPGGPSYYSVKLKTALEELGQKVDLIAFREVRKYPSGWRHLLFFFKVLRRAKRFDWIIILDTVSVALPATLAGKCLGVPTIIRTGGDFVWEQYVDRTKEKILLSEFYIKNPKLSKKEKFLIWLQKKIIFPNTNWLVFNTSWQCSIWEKPYGLNLKKTAVIENAYQHNSISATQKHTNYSRQKTDFIAAWRPTTFKNMDTLEKAFALVADKIPDFSLKIYKNIPKSKLQEHMKTARAIIIPSLSELGPNLAMESIAMGLPVILTKDCGVRERLSDFVLWIDPRNKNEIAEAIMFLCDDNNYKNMKTKLRGFTFKHSYTEIAKEFLALMEHAK